MEKITFHWNIVSQSSRAVKSLLLLGGIPHQEVFIDIGKNESRTKQYLAMNPLGQVPCIKQGSLVLGESNAILTYLCQKYSDKIPRHYYPFENLQKRAKVDQYLSWYQSTFRPRLLEIIVLKLYGKVKRGDNFTTAQLDLANKKMHEALQSLDISLAGDKYVCGGSQPTIVDLLVFHEVLNLMYYQQSWEKYQNLDKWFKKMYGLPACKQVVHDWFPQVKEFALMLATVKPVDPKL